MAPKPVAIVCILPEGRIGDVVTAALKDDDPLPLPLPLPSIRIGANNGDIVIYVCGDMEPIRGDGDDGIPLVSRLRFHVPHRLDELRMRNIAPGDPIGLGKLDG